METALTLSPQLQCRFATVFFDTSVDHTFVNLNSQVVTLVMLSSTRSVSPAIDAYECRNFDCITGQCYRRHIDDRGLRCLLADVIRMCPLDLGTLCVWAIRKICKDSAWTVAYRRKHCDRWNRKSLYSNKSRNTMQNSSAPVVKLSFGEPPNPVSACGRLFIQFTADQL